MSKKIRLVIADDHQILIDGLTTILSNEEKIEIVGKAENGKEALRLAERLSPDIVLMDLDMPIMNGMVAGKEIKKQFPNIKVIILSFHVNTFSFFLFIFQSILIDIDFN